MTASTTVESTLIPREVLFGNPLKMQPRISPDGTMMAYVAPVDNVLNVWVGTVGEDNARPVTKDSERGIRIYFWAQDNRHIMYLQDTGGNENWRLHAVNIETSESRDLTPFENVQVQVIDQSKHFPDELLIGLNKDNPQAHDVYNLNLTTGDLTKVAANPGNIVGWVADADFKVRGAMAATPTGGFDLLVRDTVEADWRNILSWDADNSLNSSPLAFTKDGKFMYLEDSRDVNAGRLVKLNLETGQLEVIAADPQYDVGSVMIHPDTYEVQALTFIKARAEWLILDVTLESDFEVLRQLSKGDYSIVSRDDADMTWLVAFVADDGPVSYYAYDRRNSEATFLFVNNPKLNDYNLTEMEPISFKSRDGLTVHGYITFPPDLPRFNLPLVVNVHGGPWHRDTWGYNPEAQWLANRGYACLQINFRGSTGYGKEFVNAGDKEWGGKMHDDVVDVVDWAVEQGVADPKRIAIYGGSYGGYEALVGATFTPDLFCCAVDIVGPSNLLTFINTIPDYWVPQLAMLHKRVGNPETEADFLKSRSPLFKVDQIKIPLLIAQGANDPRVKQAESEQIVEAMQNKGIEHEYMLFPDEGHGFAKPVNRLRFYAAAEKFLAKHLGGRFEE